METERGIVLRTRYADFRPDRSRRRLVLAAKTRLGCCPRGRKSLVQGPLCPPRSTLVISPRISLMKDKWTDR